ncbi:MAG: response regulator [Candidatus Anammoxibacter sp.]
MTTANNEHCNKKTRVYLVDDHAVICDGLAKLINLEEDIMVCGTSTDPDEAFKNICSQKPDVVIVDLILKDMNGLSLVRDIVSKFPNIPILILSMMDESIYAERALQAGAMGYVMKDQPGEEVLKGIRNLVAGKKFVSEELTERMLDRLVGQKKGKSCSPFELLTNRELEVFSMTGNGRNSKQIAEKLHISVKTVETHHFNIKAKLDLKNVNELIEYAVKWVLSQK